MSQLPGRAFAEIRLLPHEEQGAIAARTLEDLEDDRRREQSLARSPGKLAALVARADAQVRAGDFRAAGLDEL